MTPFRAFEIRTKIMCLCQRFFPIRSSIFLLPVSGHLLGLFLGFDVFWAGRGWAWLGVAGRAGVAGPGWAGVGCVGEKCLTEQEKITDTDT